MFAHMIVTNVSQVHSDERVEHISIHTRHKQLILCGAVLHPGRIPGASSFQSDVEQGHYISLLVDQSTASYRVMDDNSELLAKTPCIFSLEQHLTVT